MRLEAAALASCLVMSAGAIPSWAEQAGSQASSPYGHGDDTKPPNGVIGAVVQVEAARIGEPAALYVMKVRQDGPAQQAGLKHGDEIVSVNGISVRGKSYEEVVSMIRGEAGTPVELEIRGTRKLSITRVPSEQFIPGSSGERAQ